MAENDPYYAVDNNQPLISVNQARWLVDQEISYWTGRMDALQVKTNRYRRQRNMLAVTIGVIAWQSYRNYKADMKKPLDRD